MSTDKISSLKTNYSPKNWLYKPFKDLLLKDLLLKDLLLKDLPLDLKDLLLKDPPNKDLHHKVKKEKKKLWC